MKFKKKYLIQRIPKEYDGSKPTGRHLKDLLPPLLSHIGGIYHERGDLIIASWPEVIGCQLAPMTEALSFDKGVLTVSVKNSTLFSHLSQYDKPKILKNLRNRFPTTAIHNIIFRMG